MDLLDYVLDLNDNFWIVNTIIGNKYFGYMVYEVKSEGRYNPLTKKNYEKKYTSKLEVIPKYKQIFKPQEFYLKAKKDLTGVWQKFSEALNKIGIQDKDIGIFGSYLIGFPIIKDVDFVIYGLDNLKKYYENNEYIKDYVKASFISKEHILSQYQKHKDAYSKKCDLLKIIGRNWSGLQIKKGVLSTPRFIDPNFKVIPYLAKPKEVLKLKVKEGLTTALLPRRAKVIYQNEEYLLLTNLWKYQSFLEDGDIIECLGKLDRTKKIIVLDEFDCYVKFLKKED